MYAQDSTDMRYCYFGAESAHLGAHRSNRPDLCLAFQLPFFCFQPLSSVWFMTPRCTLSLCMDVAFRSERRRADSVCSKVARSRARLLPSLLSMSTMRRFVRWIIGRSPRVWAVLLIVTSCYVTFGEKHIHPRNTSLVHLFARDQSERS